MESLTISAGDSFGCICPVCDADVSWHWHESMPESLSCPCCNTPLFDIEAF